MIKPAWIDLSPDQWPAGARTLFSLLAKAAERRLAAEDEQVLAKQDNSSEEKVIA